MLLLLGRLVECMIGLTAVATCWCFRVCMCVCVGVVRVLCPNKYAVQFLLRLLFHIYSGHFFRCSCSFTPHTDFVVVATVAVATLLHFSRLFSSFSFHFQCNIRAAPFAGHIVARYAFWHLKETQEITTKQVRGLLLVEEREQVID